MRAILYDVDGLMVDSEQLGINVAERVMNNLGIQLTEEEKLSFIGVTDEKFYRNLFQTRGIELKDVDDILREHFGVYESKLPSVPVFPGVADSVERFKPHYKLAIVSGSTLYQVDTILEVVGIKEHFDVKVACEDYNDSKPHPQPYQVAAERLGVQPDECVVLEDAPSGIQSAKTAGMYVIGVKAGNQGRLDLSLADQVVETLDEVTLDLVQRLQ